MMTRTHLLLSCCTALYCASVLPNATAQERSASGTLLNILQQQPSDRVSETASSRLNRQQLQPGRTIFSPDGKSTAFFPGSGTITPPPSQPAIAPLPAKDTEEDVRKNTPIISKKAAITAAPAPKTYVITRMPGESDADFFNRKYNNIPAPGQIAETPANVIKPKPTTDKNSIVTVSPLSPIEKTQVAPPATPDPAPTPTTTAKGNIYTPGNLEIQDNPVTRGNVATLRQAPSLLNNPAKDERYDFLTPGENNGDIDIPADAPLPWQTKESIRIKVPAPQRPTPKGLETVYRKEQIEPIVQQPAVPFLPSQTVPLSTVEQSQVKKKIVRQESTRSQPITRTPARRSPPKAMRKPDVPAYALAAATAAKASVTTSAASAPAARVTSIKTDSVVISDLAPPAGSQSVKKPKQRLSLFEEARKRRLKAAADRKKEAERKAAARKKAEADRKAAELLLQEKAAAAEVARKKEAEAEAIRQQEQASASESLRQRMKIVKETVAEDIAVPLVEAVEKDIPHPVERMNVAKKVVDPVKTKLTPEVSALRDAIQRRAASRSALPPSDSIEEDLADLSDMPSDTLDSKTIQDELAENIPGFEDSPMDEEDVLAEMASLAELDQVTASATVNSGISFEVGADKLTSNHKKILNTFISDKASQSNDVLYVTGYATAADKTPQYISLRRVVAVRNYIMEKGFPNNRIRIKAKGDDVDSPTQRDRVILEMRPK